MAMPEQNRRVPERVQRFTARLKALPWHELVAVLVVVVVLVGLPAVLWYWRTSAVPKRYGANTKVITLTAVAAGGIWTQEEIVGHNYWRGTPRRVLEIPLTQGDHVVMRLRSADVLHSFAIPLLRLGPVDVPAGHTVVVEFDARRAGVLTFLCWQVCSPDHHQFRGRFRVEARKAEEGW